MTFHLDGAGHYLNQCWNIVYLTLGNKLQWNLNRYLYIFIQENVFENVVCEMVAICLGHNVLNDFYRLHCMSWPSDLVLSCQDVTLKESLIKTVDLIGQAVHPDHLKTSYTFLQRKELLPLLEVRHRIGLQLSICVMKICYLSIILTLYV